ncbi:hypothetical protein QVD17_17814 [Tagetes erecta]|uniref:WD repeat-containing protein 44 n=1 Tax=Tagetes erecta TaxID=13708 RepID=A0AAD8P0L2_TARER|nr:hypothetical protein QVD17_17814 [Tagetes erecta]
MERRTVTMNWDDLDDFIGEDDEFFESTSRLSVVVPLDMPLPEFDDDDHHQQFNHTRVNSIKEPQVDANVPSTSQYDMWMVAPGSITDRRRRLLQGMGLNSNKDFARLPTNKFNKPSSKRLVSIKPIVTPPIDHITKSDEKPNVDLLVKESSPPLQESKSVEHELHQTNAQPEPQDKTEQLEIRQSQPEPQTKYEPEPYKSEQLHAMIQDHDGAQTKAQVSSQPILLVRCRSDSDIETSSFNTKRRKEDMIGSVSKQHLTRTSSELVKPSVGLSCHYANILRFYTPNTTLLDKSTSNTNNKKNEQHSAQLDSFYLIKNLDTGNEFVVKEFNDEGMWNKVSDLQTGKQLTMDEFEHTVGHSPVVKELMRRTSRKRNGNINSKLAMTNSYLSKSFRNSKKKGAAFLKNLKGSMSGSKTTEKEKDESHVTTNTTTTATTIDTSSSLSSSQHKTGHVEDIASNDNNSKSEWVKAKAYGKSSKEFSALHLCQKIEAHDGSIWTMKFSFDGQYLASGGEDKVIYVWQVQECDVKSMRSGEDKGSSTPDNRPPLPDNPTVEKKKKSKNSKKKSEVPEYVKVPESMFGLSEKPVCTFSGHQDDVLDLSWSRSQLLLSSSMDKTVRLWDIKSKKCLKQFAHSDYVTCIQFNPTNDDYFISGSLDKKVRMWSVPSRKVVDWSDLHDMITSVCYSPDGQGAIVGLHNGNCKSYSTADCKLEQKDQIELHTKAKADPKKITSFQFSPLNPSEVLVTSADSRIRIIEGLHVIEKLIGYKNSSSQFSAQYSADGKYVICASEDSQVYIWKHEKTKNSGGAKTKYVTTTSYEHFVCTEVTVAVPWHGHGSEGLDKESKRSVDHDNVRSSQLPPVPTNEQAAAGCNSNRSDDGSTAWGMVIVTAGLDGEIRVYQNVGLPIKLGNLF